MVEIIPNSPAAEAGLRPLDVVVEIDNKPVETMTSLRKMLYKYKFGDKAILKINRDGREQDVEIQFKDF